MFAKILVKLFGTLRLHGTGSRIEVNHRASVAGILEELFALHPVLREHIVTPDGTALLPYVSIMVNGRMTRDLQGLETPVWEGDVLAIFPPSAGG